MSEATHIIETVSRTTTMHFLAAQTGDVPQPFENLYFQRNLSSAPPLSEQFDDRAQAIYRGLDPKTVFFPAANRGHYPDESEQELAAIADALNQHGADSLFQARDARHLDRVNWLGLASKDGHAIIDDAILETAGHTKQPDDLGYFRRIPKTDFAVVGPKQDNDLSLSLAMGVADCLAIPVIDTATHAFGFAHAGRPGTGLRTSEQTANMLIERFGSRSRHLVAYLGEGVCQPCYKVDEKTYDGFVEDFGGRTEIDKVLEQYPEALAEFTGQEGKQIGIDLYAFNKYLLASQRIGEIIVAPNCTARMNAQCATLDAAEVESVPEGKQRFFSHERAKGKTVGWTTEDGRTIELNTFHLTTPRNLTTLTRH